MRRWAPLLGITAALLPGVAAAHRGAAATGRFPDALGEWSWDPLAFVSVAVLGGMYGWGYRRLRRDPRPFRFPAWHAAAFATGLALLLLAFASPIDTYADDLFWVHMVQHMLLVMGAAPLLLLGAPVTLALRAASPRVRRAYLVPLLDSRAAALLTQPLVGLLALILTIWLWHLPAAYEAALDSWFVHVAEHASFLFGAGLFWWLIIGVDATRLRPGYAARLALLIGAILQTVALALILTAVDEPIYDSYANLVRDWGPSALRDQRIGGGVMWVPGAMMFALALLATLYYWAEHEGFKGRQGDLLRELERRHAA